MPVINAEKTVEIITTKLAALPGQCTVGISGGIDSAVIAALCAKAKGPENVNGVFSGLKSSETSLRRARAVAEALGIKLIELELTTAFDSVVSEVLLSAHSAQGMLRLAEVEDRMAADPLVLGSFRSCFRAPILRFVNRLFGGGLVHGTGNEDEDRWLRFYQKGGDGEVDTNPIASLSKGEVRQIAIFLGIPEEVISCKPTPALWGVGDQHSDEDELAEISGVPWTYSVVDTTTGEYTKVGTIERMSRLLDKTISGAGLATVTVEQLLFGNAHHYSVEAICSYLHSCRVDMMGLTPEHLASARKWEQSTRHKMNPNIPSIVTRDELKLEGCITDTLPKSLLTLT